MAFEKTVTAINGPIIVMGSVVIETPRKIELRIGQPRQGESRYALLTPREALRVAAVLIEAAEDSLANADAKS